MEIEEVWKPTHVYSDYYEVSNLGKVKGVDRVVDNTGIKSGWVSVKGIILKQSLNKKGYPVVYLSKQGKQKTITVHRLVAFAFIDNVHNKPQVNHINGIKTDNRAVNLEWCDNSENQLHAYKNGFNKASPNAGRPRKKVHMLDPATHEVLASFDSLAEAGKKTRINQFNIRSVCEGERNKAGGFKWKYKGE